MSDRYRSRPFDPNSTDPRHVIAEALARQEGFGDIPPGAWWRAAHVVKALKSASMLRTARERKAHLAPEADHV